MNLTQFDITPSRIRTIELENGNILRMEAKDPYGLISFSLEHGQLPVYLQGASFTDWQQAEAAAAKYQHHRKMAIAESTIQEPAPSLTDKKKK